MIHIPTTDAPDPFRMQVFLVRCSATNEAISNMISNKAFLMAEDIWVIEPLSLNPFGQVVSPAYVHIPADGSTGAYCPPESLVPD